jgi:predicted nucleic acid-binding protein
VASLVDTNVLVYAHDARFPAKRKRAKEVLDRGVSEGTLRLPHQAFVEFVAVTTRRRADGSCILELPDAIRKAEALLRAFEVLYPTPAVVRTAMVGATLHQLPWFDAHLWACAEANGIEEILSEDFQHGRIYGSVRVVNPFLDPRAA